MLAAALLLLAAQLAAATTASGGSSSASSAAAWPHSVQPFWLSALNTKLTAADARYLGSLPVVVVNHKQGPGRGKQAEANQLLALSQVKAANASCATFFYLNSQIDFPELQLHEQFVANGRSTYRCCCCRRDAAISQRLPHVLIGRAGLGAGSWWLKTDGGAFVLHGRDKIFDWSVPAARDAWLATAQRALSQPYISGVFVDKAGGFGPKGVRRGRMRRWSSGHAQLLQALGAAAAAAKKRLIFNNEGKPGVAGQLFERWGAKEDHDGLSKSQQLVTIP